MQRKVEEAPVPRRPTLHELFGGVHLSDSLDAKGTLTGGAEGAPLPEHLRGKFEASTGADLDAVRIHTGAAANARAKGSHAKAIAEGNDIHFADGQYDPESASGQTLLAHEVVHTVQKQGATPRPQHKGQISNASDAAEIEADHAAAAMIAGAPTSITRSGAADRVMAKTDRELLLDSIKAAIAAGNWSDAAVRLNGLSDGDLMDQVGKLNDSPGKLAHIREAAETTMVGWSQRVTKAIDEVGGSDIANVANLYLAYEKAVAKAKTNGNWKEVADRLNGMGEWDALDRLSKLTWFQLMDIKKVATPRASAFVDKADAKRVQRAVRAYQDALRASDWKGVAQQLNGFDDAAIERSMRALVAGMKDEEPKDGEPKEGEQKPKKEKDNSGLFKLQEIRKAAIAIMPDHHKRVTEPIDRILEEYKDELAKMTVRVAASVPIPDVSDDKRPLVGLDLSNFGGNEKVIEFATKLAEVHESRKPADTKPDKDGKVPRTHLQELAWGFKATYDGHVATQPDVMRSWDFGTYASRWMSEMRERMEWKTALAFKGPWLHEGAAIDTSKLERLVTKNDYGGSQFVDPVVNIVISQLIDAFPGTRASTYKAHGDKKDGPVVWAPFCVDVDAPLPMDYDRKLYSAEGALKFLNKFNKICESSSATWSACYNDASVNAEANKRFGNRMVYAGDQGTTNWHGALRLHFHFYIVPTSGPSPTSAPGLNPQAEH